MGALRNLTYLQKVVFIGLIVIIIMGILLFASYPKSFLKPAFSNVPGSTSGSGPKPTCSCPENDELNRPFICERLYTPFMPVESAEKAKVTARDIIITSKKPIYDSCSYDLPSGYKCNILTGNCYKTGDIYNIGVSCKDIGTIFLPNDTCQLENSQGEQFTLNCYYCGSWNTPTGNCSSSACEIGTCRQPTYTYDANGNCIYANSPNNMTCELLDSECKNIGVGICSSGQCVPNLNSCPDTSCGSGCSPTNNGWGCSCATYQPRGTACTQNGLPGTCSGSSGRCMTVGMPYP